MKKFLKNHFWEIITALIGFGGIIASIISAIASNIQGFHYVFWVVVASEFILLLLGCWNLKIKYLYQKEKNELKDLSDKKESDFKKQIANLLSKESTTQKDISKITKKFKNLCKLNNDFCYRIPDLTIKSYRFIENLSKSILDDDAKKTQIENTKNEYSNSLFDLYKRYTTNILNETLDLLATYLNIYGKKEKLSATVKLFNTPYKSNYTNAKDIIVYTAFRDKITFEEHKREIGSEPYTITGNADFVRCLSKDQFIINNECKKR